ncbi:hypothetical protein [Kitasatospora sp. NPDC098663]|uniref:hypothetical protein n=1 Tax=Kitasatospora sp. NPDC098663 TaxID=3364096 RepID=UPI0037FFDEB9
MTQLTGTASRRPDNQRCGLFAARTDRSRGPGRLPAVVPGALARGSGTRGPDQQAFVTIADLIREQAVPGELAAALYQAAARTPGVVLLDSATDAAGRQPGNAQA